MRKFFWFSICIVFSYTAPSFAKHARAVWVDPAQIKLKLPPGFYVSSFTQFYFTDGTNILSNSRPLALPVLRMENGYAWLSTAQFTKQDIDTLIRRPLKVVISNNNRSVLDSTSVQYAGLLDNLYYYDGDDLGGRCYSANCTLRLWAPTAQEVKLLLFKNSSDPVESATTKDLRRNDKGVWLTELPVSYENYYYLYQVTVYSPLHDNNEVTYATDPYSFSLALNGIKSQLVNLESAAATPNGWWSLGKPILKNLKDSVIYELHVRDFSANDSTVPPEEQGTYLAFARYSNGTRHLQDLAESGLTHVHLLPINDFGSVNEIKSQWEVYNHSSNNLQEPQSIIGGMRAGDSFNWGYDPVHYFAPEGSYAVNGNGISRIKEVRSMVQALNGNGLRVVQDVVLNHTYEAGLDLRSVFDKIVPLYYYRLDSDGIAYKSSCCWDTAGENRMMEKLMIDSVVFLAKTYKLDGFRFDLMSFHTRTNMARIRQALTALTLAKDGVDGSKLLLYGEGWNFGSLYSMNAQEAMTIDNTYGSGYGFFNDRLRDAVRGGTTSSSEKSDQGFATGLYFDFNKEPANRGTPWDMSIQRDRILHYGDVIKVGLAGNLRDFFFREHFGNNIRAGDLRFRDSQVAFSSQAIETINYVSAHDGYGLWDAIQAKAPLHTQDRHPAIATSEERRRMHQLAMSIPLLGQGIPFVESATELLRSKNGDQDSYDSGDFFNRIDWSGKTNYWAAGLPPAWKNINDWSFWQPRLQNEEMKVTSQQITQTKEYFKALLRLRQSSDLFKMNTPNEIAQHLRFIDNDKQAEPGLIAMHLHNDNEQILIFFNASREARYFSHDLLRQPWNLHPLFNDRIDSTLSQVVLFSSQSSVQIPGRTTLVLQLKKSAEVH